MDYQKAIPLTSSGLVVAGVAVGRYWIIIASILIVGLGALLIRLFFRRGKKATQL